ncbi:MAG: Unknown protein [uncultured Sulfurovum sp.]|uniref:Uncharacterized protein n=1 Tax=uncultured Sulfurovum sp. TaxID=269237 RepID=A0A6S6SY12_9BACT|nr:MAG: Unknown protein [uncultured Sulfurovum sp.]
MNDLEKKIQHINSLISSQLWFDFEVHACSRQTVKILGGLDLLSNKHDLEIVFKEVFFVSCPMEWKSDTSLTVLSIIEGDRKLEINKHFQVEQEHILFEFLAEDYDKDFSCILSAKFVDYIIPESSILEINACNITLDTNI